MTRTEFVNQVFSQLESQHLYLYHDISKEEFEKHKQKFLKNVDKLDKLHFAAGICKLFALFKDAHTSCESVVFSRVGTQVRCIDEDFYLKVQGKFRKILKVNGFDIKTVVPKLSQLICYEVRPWLNYKLTRLLRSPLALAMVDCGQENAQTITFATDAGEIVCGYPGERDDETLYESKKISDQILYIKYSQCDDMQNYPFKQFVENLDKDWQTKPKVCIVDLRFNTGGNSNIIKPLLVWLEKNKIRPYALINEGTFSSGIFAISDLKKLGAKLFGTPAGQPTACFGECRTFNVDGAEFRYCVKYFEFGFKNENSPVEPTYPPYQAFDYRGEIRPDIEIKPNVEDLNNGIDTQLQQSIKIIERDLAQIVEL